MHSLFARFYQEATGFTFAIKKINAKDAKDAKDAQDAKDAIYEDKSFIFASLASLLRLLR
ncbi:MAG: hypothetical protein DRR16_22545 [Candidatus Parabeggiatoa sp. nov. 3]|nr:MAG: hypothetical protein DRR16_22545 [Gammaproteobacteria bacterium]